MYSNVGNTNPAPHQEGRCEIYWRMALSYCHLQDYPMLIIQLSCKKTPVALGRVSAQTLATLRLLNSLSNRILKPRWWVSVGGIIVCSERGAFFSFYSCCWILISWINKNKLPSYCSRSPFDSWLDLLQIHPFGNENGINTFLMHSSGILSPWSTLRPPRSSFSEWWLITCPSSTRMRYNFERDHVPWLTDCSVSYF